ncbi:RNA polymerase-associated protein RapA [Methylobacterium brachiatum]|nr:RNA polymerase-associated protein RapA [Methylobacterium brachiatum]
MGGRFKLLLTATPLQNSLLELFGLVSMIDDSFFGDENSFKALYGGKPDRVALAGLRKRLDPVYKRHLRKDVQAAGHVAFTKREVVTVNFEPDDQEVELYNAVSAYLQRPHSVAFGGPPNPLLLTVARKILGSSTAAIIRFLETILARLQARQAMTLEALADIDDAGDLAAEVQEEIGEVEEGGEAGFAPGSLAVVEAEIAEVEGYLALARSIGANSKGDMLVAQLPALLDEVEAKRGRRKAVIFTESVQTQRYLADILAGNGFDGRIVLLNGTNSDPGSQTLYRDWTKRHAGTEAISGSKSADTKAAIVEAFRGDDTTILIATESGAEGINLQFCSLLVNFDLPWNPQRVEQRIGRCHRYGQKLDVVVVNFLNLRNRVEARVHDLLRHKFNLFEGVFGASDDVLGAIASGVDFERDILRIAQSCRTDAEIEAAFAELETALDARIEADMAEARRKLFDHMDQGVVARLKARNEDIVALLSDFERGLLTVARAELPDARFHDEASNQGLSRRFEYDGETWTTEWPLADDRGWRFFRLGDGNLATALVEQAAARDLAVGHVVFDAERLRAAGLPGFADVDRLKGQGGWLRVSCISFGTAAEGGAPREAFVVAAATDAGDTLDPETVDHLFMTPGEHRGAPDGPPPDTRLAALERALEAVRLEEARAQNARWLDEEDDRLDAQVEDLMRAADEKSKSLDAEARAASRALRGNSAISLEEKVKERRRIKGLEIERDRIVLETFNRRNSLRQAAEDNLDRLEASLAITPKLTPLLTIRWEVAA